MRPATVLALIAMGVLAGCGSSASTRTAVSTGASLASGCRATNPADQTARTASYVFLLHVGGEEKMVMLSPSEARAKHITSGELMIGGSMSPGMSPSGMSGHTTMRHLEVHICHRASGTVVTGAMPAITVIPAAGGPPRLLPVAVMQGVTAGAGDLHYGNNVALRANAIYTVTVRLGADRVAFKYTAPRGM
jgi:hypothetical protein